MFLMLLRWPNPRLETGQRRTELNQPSLFTSHIYIYMLYNILYIYIAPNLGIEPSTLKPLYWLGGLIEGTPVVYNQ